MSGSWAGAPKRMPPAWRRMTPATNAVLGVPLGRACGRPSRRPDDRPLAHSAPVRAAVSIPRRPRGRVDTQTTARPSGCLYGRSSDSAQIADRGPHGGMSRRPCSRCAVVWTSTPPHRRPCAVVWEPRRPLVRARRALGRTVVWDPTRSYGRLGPYTTARSSGRSDDRCSPRTQPNGTG